MFSIDSYIVEKKVNHLQGGAIEGGPPVGPIPLGRPTIPARGAIEEGPPRGPTPHGHPTIPAQIPEKLKMHLHYNTFIYGKRTR